MTKLPIIVCRIDTAAGPKDYVTCLQHEHVLQHGLPAEAVIGELLQSVDSRGAITPSNFARNRTFVDFLHSVIARCGPELPGLIADAQRQGEGWVYVIDQRTPTPQGAVPPEDILGAFEVKEGQFVPGSYRPSQKHLIFSADGFVRLGAELQTCLLEELTALAERKVD